MHSREPVSRRGDTKMVEFLATESVIVPATRWFALAEREQCSRFALRMLSALEAAGLADSPTNGEPAAKSTTRQGRRAG